MKTVNLLLKKNKIYNYIVKGARGQGFKDSRIQGVIRMFFLGYLCLLISLMFFYSTAVCREKKNSNEKEISLPTIENNVKTSLTILFNTPQNIIVKTQNDKSHLKLPKDTVELLLVKIENGNVRGLNLDSFTMKLKNATINLDMLMKKNILSFSKFESKEVGILVTISEMKRFINVKAKEKFTVSYKNFTVDLQEPYGDVKVEIPADEFPLYLLGPFASKVKGKFFKCRGLGLLYTNKLKLNAKVEKLAINHFLVPRILYRNFEKEFNPLEDLKKYPLSPNIKTFRIQGKYLFLSSKKL